MGGPGSGIDEKGNGDRVRGRILGAGMAEKEGESDTVTSISRNRSTSATTYRDWLRASGVQVIILGLAIVFRHPMFGANFAEIAPQQAYRSAQLRESLGPILAQNHIGTVLNLRGGSDRDPWYRHEVEAVAKAGADFYDLPLQPNRRPTQGELLTLVDLFERCRYPILIHCKSGADRTGMVSGLYLMMRAGTPPEAAIKAFSITHSHIALGGPEHLHEPFLEYASWLKSRHLTHSADRFRHWLRDEYEGPDGGREFQPIQPGARLARRAAEAGKSRH